ncbi:hypothetical protein EKO04_004429 [Ascochyta lentis]|uniref:C3H1-type domain-containing protein n=1 Tax=Ascochyta lentis TaxID=205686 RepID=A0A8H7J6S5_9PLEO|nr:hypothetical protein EKO04_004429 [Ascochyta lentis]
MPGFVSTLAKAIMSAKDKVVTESTSTDEIGDTALKDQPTSRKRPRESESSVRPSKPLSTSLTFKQPPPQTTKKARTYGEKELESLMVDVCLERIERRQIEQGRAQLNQTGREIITGELKNIFCQLKRVDTEGYTTHIHHLESTCAGHRGDEKIEKAVLNFFDRNGLLRLHAQLQGNGRWHMILRGLGLPLTDLRNLDANLRFQTNDIERQLKSEIADILTWLTQGKVSRNDTVNTNMRPDEILEDGQLCVSQPPVSIVQYVLSNAHIKEILALVSSTSNAVILPKPDQKRPEPSRVIERQPSVEPTAPIKQDSDDTQQGSNQDAAMALARSLPQQKADAYYDGELKRTVATCSKIQTYGQAYNIVIEQLKSAQNGGPTPTFVSDLQMPDAEACYYRLESLWNRALQAINHRGVEHLRTNIDLFYTFAICMREAHCLLRVLHYYGCDVSQLVGTGWDLDGMRRLQSELVDFAHEEPFIWSKPDVDAICTALQAAHNQHALLTGSQPSRFGVVESCEPEASDPVAQPIAQPIYHPVDYQAPTEMEVDQAPQTCSFFLNKGGCTKVGDARRPCNFDHPENLKYNTACPNLKNSQCRFGDIGCRYRHDIANTPTPTGASPSGKKRDPGLGSSYCRGHQQGNCRKGDHCTWLHDTPPPGLLYQNVAPSNFTTDNPFQSGGQKTPCQFLAKGSCKYSDTQCKYSHDPAVFANHKTIPQPLGDATMGGAASNGDNTHQRPRSEMPCRNENNGRHCTKLSCWFAHMNPQSAAYTDANGYAAGDEMEPQNSRRGRGGRAQKDFTYRPNQPVAFSQLPQMQTADDARARIQQVLLNNARTNNAARTNNQGRTRGNGGRLNNRGQNRGQNSGIQSNGPQNQGNMHNVRSNRRGGRSNQTNQ